MSKQIIPFYILAFVGLAFACNPPIPTASLAEMVHQRKSELFVEAQQYVSNAEKEVFVTNATVAFDDTAATFQAKIREVLPRRIVDAYKAERGIYSAWYAFQQTVSLEVISDLWELYAGGSAGGSFQVIHLYDIANTNATEQEILYSAIAEKSFPERCYENASFEQIDSTRAQLCLEFRNLYSQHEKIGSEGYPTVKNVPEQLDSLLDTDVELFKKWMSARDALEPLLDKGVRYLYSSHTAYWKHLYQRNYQERFIRE